MRKKPTSTWSPLLSQDTVAQNFNRLSLQWNDIHYPTSSHKVLQLYIPCDQAHQNKSNVISPEQQSAFIYGLWCLTRQYFAQKKDSWPIWRNHLPKRTRGGICAFFSTGVMNRQRDKVGSHTYPNPSPCLPSPSPRRPLYLLQSFLC